MTIDLHPPDMQQAGNEPALIAIRRGGSKIPLFCVHASEGHLRLFENLARHLDPDRPVYGLRGLVRDRIGGVPYASFEEMAKRYVGEIREARPHGPYVVVGECNGGQLAYEVAQELRSGGADVALLVLIDSYGPGGPHLGRVVPPRVGSAVDYIRMLGFHLRTAAQLPAENRREYLLARAKRALGPTTARVRGAAAPEQEELRRKQGFGEALSAYRPAPYGGRVALLRGQRLPWGVSSIRHLGWGDFAADLGVYELPCYFGTSLLEPPVRQLASRLAQLLNAEVECVGAPLEPS